MSHPDIDGYAEVTEEALVSLYEPKGWVAVTDADRARSLDGMRKADLQAEAERLGIDTTGTADDLRERIATTNKGAI
jgi:hypothetical protein